jgi:hypothetical protein
MTTAKNCWNRGKLFLKGVPIQYSYAEINQMNGDR